MDSDFDHSNIEHDPFDRAVFQGLIETVPELADLVERGGNLLPGWEVCLFDLFCVCFKLNLRLVPAEAVSPSRRFHRKIVEDFLASEGVRRVREQTALDEVRSGLVLLAVGRAIVREIKEEGLLISRELKEIWELAQLERRREEIADQLETFRNWEDGREAFREAAEQLAEELAVAEAQGEQLAQEIEASVEALPVGLKSRLETEATLLEPPLAALEEAQTAFSRSVGVPLSQSAGERLTLALHLQKNRKLWKLAAYIGRMRAQARAVRAARLACEAGELHRITTGADVSRLIPSELAILHHPLLRRDFLRRRLEERLLCYEIEAPEREGRGPMIVLIDGSGSMSGERDVWAKALALSLFEMARRQRRKFVAVSFSSGEAPLRPFTFEAPLRPSDLVAFAEYFPGGGTDFVAPLRYALERLRESRYRRGDVVLVTDGACQVPEAWLEEFLVEKERLEFSVFSLLIETGEDALAGVRPFSDRITTLAHLEDEAIREIFLDI